MARHTTPTGKHIWRTQKNKTNKQKKRTMCFLTRKRTRVWQEDHVPTVLPLQQATPDAAEQRGAVPPSRPLPVPAARSTSGAAAAVTSTCDPHNRPVTSGSSTCTHSDQTPALVGLVATGIGPAPRAEPCSTPAGASRASQPGARRPRVRA